MTKANKIVLPDGTKIGSSVVLSKDSQSYFTFSNSIPRLQDWMREQLAKCKTYEECSALMKRGSVQGKDGVWSMPDIWRQADSMITEKERKQLQSI